MDKFVRLRTEDNVVIASRALQAGDQIEGILTRETIPMGHKIATVRILEGSSVRKFGQIIGYVAQDVLAGAHIHTHNLEFRPTEGLYEFGTDVSALAEASAREIACLRSLTKWALLLFLASHISAKI